MTLFQKRKAINTFNMAMCVATTVFGLFWLGIAATVWTGIFYCWIIFDVVHALVSSSLLMLTLVLLWRWRRQITELFYFERDEATRFCDLRPLTGPRALPRASSAIG